MKDHEILPNNMIFLYLWFHTSNIIHIILEKNKSAVLFQYQIFFNQRWAEDEVTLVYNYMIIVRINKYNKWNYSLIKLN